MRPFLYGLAILMPVAAQTQTCDERSQGLEARITLCDHASEAAETSGAGALPLKGEAQHMLGQLGFLPLSNSPSGVLTALRRCIDVKST